MQNSNFINIIKNIRAIMPGLGVFMVVVVYLVSAFAGGSFLTQLTNSSVLGFSIAFAIQCTRAIIVFFNQMNPGRPVFGFLGETCAIVFGLFSIYEMHNLTTSYPSAVFVSVALLMVAGIVIEILLLREVKYSTEQELINNPALLTQIQQNAISRANLKAHLEAIRQAETSGGSIPTMQQATPPLPNLQQGKGNDLSPDELKSMIVNAVHEFMKAKPANAVKVDRDVLEELELSLNVNNGHAVGNGNGKH